MSPGHPGGRGVDVPFRPAGGSQPSRECVALGCRGFVLGRSEDCRPLFLPRTAAELTSRSLFLPMAELSGGVPGSVRVCAGSAQLTCRAAPVSQGCTVDCLLSFNRMLRVQLASKLPRWLVSQQERKYMHCWVPSPSC